MADTAVRPERPLPRFPQSDTEPFWDAAREKRLMYQVCRRCGGIVFYPRGHCTHCTSLDLEWRQSAGRGAIYTYTVIRQHGHPYFKARAPYVVAFVDLDEGFRMLAEVTASPEAVAVGARVALEWDDAGERAVPVFALGEG
jgi:uncharacterized protein